MDSSQENTSPQEQGSSLPEATVCPWCGGGPYKSERGLRVHQSRCPKKPSPPSGGRTRDALARDARARMEVDSILNNLPAAYLKAHLRSVATELLAYPYARWQGAHEAEDRVLDRAAKLIRVPGFVDDCWSVCRFLNQGAVDYARRAAAQVVRIACFESVIVEGHKVHATERRSAQEHVEDE